MWRLKRNRLPVCEQPRNHMCEAQKTYVKSKENICEELNKRIYQRNVRERQKKHVREAPKAYAKHEENKCEKQKQEHA